MRNLARSPFVAVFQTEVLFNSKRIAPYAMAILCGGNALLWWGWGPAAGRGWATNSDHFIAGVFPVFSFMTLPLFTALMMGDPVIRDFRAGVDALIFSKPVSRAEYLLGKFFGNFFVLVCCQSAFALTLLLLQAFHPSQMIVQPVRVLPYFKHFFFLVVISHLVLAAVYFTIGTLTRNVKIVYGLAVSFYPLYIAYQVGLLKGLPLRWRVILDPLLMNWGDEIKRGRNADWLNQLVISYDSDMLLNRALMILIAAICLAILYAGFTKTERRRNARGQSHVTLLNVSTGVERVYRDGLSLQPARPDHAEKIVSHEKVMLPVVNTQGDGFQVNLRKLRAALGVEFRLLRSERSLVVITPLALFLSTLELAFYDVAPAPSYSAAYASITATNLLIFLFGINVFYTGEAMHRDRESRIESILWSTTAPDYVLLVSKFLATVMLTLSLIALVALTAIALQFFKGQRPIEISAFLKVYSLILVPSVIFMAAVSVLLNALLRDKYLVYALSIAIGVGLYYLYGQGYRHWLYNPTLYGLWTYADLTGGGSNQARIILHRIYCLAVAGGSLSLAHLCFQRPSMKRFLVQKRRPSSKGRAALIAIISITIALITGFMLISRAS
jgi:ABC-2 type transport system permease protein